VNVGLWALGTGSGKLVYRSTSTRDWEVGITWLVLFLSERESRPVSKLDPRRRGYPGMISVK